MKGQQKVDVRQLARLARLEMPENELEKLERDIPGILKFVETIQGADAEAAAPSPQLHNVMRADENPIEPGAYTEKLLDAAPAREGNRVAVKQVVSRKRT